MASQLEMALGGMLSGGSAMPAWPASINEKQTSGALWEEEVVQLMMGRPLHHHLDVARPSSNSSSSSPSLPISKNVAPCSTTLDLLGAASSSSLPPPLPFASEDPESSSSARCFDLDADAPLPSGWEKCLDLQTGSIYYLNRSTGLSTSCDPRKATATSANWPTSPPSSSSDLTVEANVPMATTSNKPIATCFLEQPSKECTNLDLTLSLKPSTPCSRPRPLNHPLNCDLKSNHKFNSLISSQGPLNKQSFLSSLNSSPFNSIRPSFSLPTCASSIASSTSPSSPLFFQELGALKDMGSFAIGISSKESKAMNMNQSLNGIPRHIANNVSMSVRENPVSRETLSSSPIINNFSVSAKAKPIINDTRMDGSSAMMTVGCANCLMFVMLPSSRSPKCPRCGAFIDSDLPPPPSLKKLKLGLSLMS